jgi:hypothetical protein
VSTSQRCEAIFCKEIGGIAQLVERRNGIAKVIGSIPFTSTMKNPQHENSAAGFFFSNLLF